MSGSENASNALAMRKRSNQCWRDAEQLIVEEHGSDTPRGNTASCSAPDANKTFVRTESLRRLFSDVSAISWRSELVKVSRNPSGIGIT